MSRLEDLSVIVQAKIQSIPLIASPPAVPVLIAWPGDLANILARMTGTQCIQVVVCQPSLARTSTDPLQRLVLATSWIFTMEKVLFNRQQGSWKSCESVAEIVAQALHNWTIPGSFGIGWTDRIEPLSNDYGGMTDMTLSSASKNSNWMAEKAAICRIYRVMLLHNFTY
jgi:hypothetical protein